MKEKLLEKLLKSSKMDDFVSEEIVVFFDLFVNGNMSKEESSKFKNIFLEKDDPLNKCARAISLHEVIYRAGVRDAFLAFTTSIDADKKIIEWMKSYENISIPGIGSDGKRIVDCDGNFIFYK